MPQSGGAGTRAVRHSLEATSVPSSASGIPSAPKRRREAVFQHIRRKAQTPQALDMGRMLRAGDSGIQLQRSAPAPSPFQYRRLDSGMAQARTGNFQKLLVALAPVFFGKNLFLGNDRHGTRRESAHMERATQMA